jgi:hypothetical protein
VPDAKAFGLRVRGPESGVSRAGVFKILKASRDHLRQFALIRADLRLHFFRAGVIRNLCSEKRMKKASAGVRTRPWASGPIRDGCGQINQIRLVGADGVSMHS